MPAEVDEGAILGYTDSYTDAFPPEERGDQFQPGSGYALRQGAGRPGGAI